MGIVKGFLHQTAIWERQTGANEADEPTYAAPVEIPARIDPDFRVSVSGGMRQILTLTRVMVGPEQEINVGDRITEKGKDPTVDGRRVEGVRPIVLVNGRLDGYTLAL